MPDTAETKEILSRYLKARIPFIAVRTAERARIREMFERLGAELALPTIAVHTVTGGFVDLKTNAAVEGTKELYAALDYAGENFGKRDNLTYVFSDIPDIEDDSQTARRILDLTHAAAERNGSLVVVTTNPVWSPLQRVGMSVTLELPTQDEMQAIIERFLANYVGVIPIEWEAEERKRAAATLAGVSQLEAENILATFVARKRIVRADLGELSHAKDRIFSDLSGIERIPTRDLNLQIGGLRALNAYLEREKPLLTADLRGRNLRPPRGIILLGVPGCGKSLSAKAIALKFNLPLYRLDLANIYGQMLGQSEARLKEALATADHVSPCVLWIDEIEKGLSGTGAGDNSGGTSTRLVGHFLFWLQESTARVFVVATANDVSQLPPELLRRGRFDEVFFVDLPTETERREIIELYVARNKLPSVDAALLDELVLLSVGFAGSDIEAGVREVAKDAFLKGDAFVTPELFRRSFRNIMPLAQTAPERIAEIRRWGAQRAVPASGIPIAVDGATPTSRRVVLT